MTAKDLRSIRLALNFTLADFGQRLGVSAIELAEYEHGNAQFDETHIAAALRRVTPTWSQLSSEVLQRHH